MVLSQTASVVLMVSPIVFSRFTGPDLTRTKLVDHIHPPLIVIGLTLPLQVTRFYVGQFAVFKFRDAEFGGDAFVSGCPADTSSSSLPAPTRASTITSFSFGEIGSPISIIAAAATLRPASFCLVFRVS